MIQTYTPENDVIQCAARQDYDAFYTGEIRMRRLRRYPPFAALFHRYGFRDGGKPGVPRRRRNSGHAAAVVSAAGAVRRRTRRFWDPLPRQW